MAPYGFSTQEFEEIGKVIGKELRTTLEKMGVDKVDEDEFNKRVDQRVTDLMKKSSTRNLPWVSTDLDPLDINNIEKKLYEPAGEDEIAKKLQDFNDDLYTIMVCTKRAPELLSSYKSYTNKWNELSKALNTATAGSGLDWIPTGYSSDMIEAVELEAKVASLFKSFRMPTNPYVYPMLLADGTAYLGGEASTDSPEMYKTSTPNTDNLTFTAIKLIANYPVTDEMTEDSIVPVLPMMRRSIAKAMAKAEDNAIVNGDTTTTHFDTGYTVSSDDARRAWKGLRRLVSDANSDLALKIDGSSWSTSNGLGIIRGAIEDMGVYGIDPDALKIILNTNMYGKMKGLDQVSTVDKFGSAATVKNGRLTGIDGVDLVLSQHVQEQQTSAGIYDAATMTDTQFLIVNTMAFWRGIRKEFTIELVRKPERGIEYLVATARRIWKPIYDTTAEGVAAWVYNVTK